MFRPSQRAEVLDLRPGLLLGMDEEPGFQTVEMPVPRGALLALYTDGLVKRPGHDIVRSSDFLADQLTEAHDEPMDMLADGIGTHAQETTDRDNSDDMALLLVRYNTAGNAQPADPTADRSLPAQTL